MSYALLSDFGTVDAFNPALHIYTPSEVYVLRLHVQGAKLRDATDALLFARAGGQGQNLKLDVRGVAVFRDDTMADNENVVDIVLTAAAGVGLSTWSVGVPFLTDSATDMATKVAADLDLRKVFPGITISDPVFGLLSAPPEAIDNWRAQPILWDHALPGPKNLGGPTDAMAQPADYNVVKGRADDGKQATPWPMPHAPLKPPSLPGGDGAIWWILGALGVVGLAGWMRQKGSRR